MTEPIKPAQKPTFDFEDTRPGDFAFVPCFCDRGKPCTVCEDTGCKVTMIKRTISGQHKRLIGIDELEKLK